MKIIYKGKNQMIEKTGHLTDDGYFYCDGSGPEELLGFIGKDGYVDRLPWLSQDGTGNDYLRVMRVATGEVIDLPVRLEF